MPDIGIKTDTTSGPNGDGILSKTEDEVVIKTITFDTDDFADGETISAITDVTITRDDDDAMGGSDLAVDSQSSSGQQVQLALSGGVIGIGYLILITILTSADQILQGKVRMAIRSP